MLDLGGCHGLLPAHAPDSGGPVIRPMLQILVGLLACLIRPTDMSQKNTCVFRSEYLIFGERSLRGALLYSYRSPSKKRNTVMDKGSNIIVTCRNS